MHTRTRTQNRDPAVLAPIADAAKELAAAGRLAPGDIRDVCASLARLGFFDVTFKSAVAEGAPGWLLGFCLRFCITFARAAGPVVERRRAARPALL